MAKKASNGIWNWVTKAWGILRDQLHPLYNLQLTLELKEGNPICPTFKHDINPLEEQVYLDVYMLDQANESVGFGASPGEVSSNWLIAKKKKKNKQERDSLQLVWLPHIPVLSLCRTTYVSCCKGLILCGSTWQRWLKSKSNSMMPDDGSFLHSWIPHATKRNVGFSYEGM